MLRFFLTVNESRNVESDIRRKASTHANIWAKKVEFQGTLSQQMRGFHECDNNNTPIREIRYPDYTAVVAA